MVSLLPKILQTKENIALEYCINNAMTVDIKPFLIYLIDNVDIRLLKYLAYQFHILGDEGWNLCENEYQQRRMLKTAISLHRLKGTKVAIEQCLEMLGFQGSIEEWFEYNGRPKRFRVNVILTNRSYSEELYQKLFRYIENYKNRRSIMESLDIMVYPKGEYYCAARTITDEVITIKGVRNE